MLVEKCVEEITKPTQKLHHNGPGDGVGDGVTGMAMGRDNGKANGKATEPVDDDQSELLLHAPEPEPSTSSLMRFHHGTGLFASQMMYNHHSLPPCST